MHFVEICSTVVCVLYQACTLHEIPEGTMLEWVAASQSWQASSACIRYAQLQPFCTPSFLSIGLEAHHDFEKLS